MLLTTYLRSSTQHDPGSLASSDGCYDSQKTHTMEIPKKGKYRFNKTERIKPKKTQVDCSPKGRNDRAMRISTIVILMLGKVVLIAALAALPVGFCLAIGIMLATAGLLLVIGGIMYAILATEAGRCSVSGVLCGDGE